MAAAIEDVSVLPDWPRWLSPAQAAAYVGVSPNQFRAEADAGMWPAAVRRGSRLTYDRKLLDRYSDRISRLDADSAGPAPLPTKPDWSDALPRVANG